MEQSYAICGHDRIAIRVRWNVHHHQVRSQRRTQLTCSCSLSIHHCHRCYRSLCLLL
ncbi:hypothetical protein LINPERPRIM_LOCUS15008 [Linum perenne]